MSNRVDISNLLNEMRAIKAQTRAFAGAATLDRPDAAVAGTAPATGFGQVLKGALGQVNQVQQASSQMAESYLRGDSGVDISQVMIASQKSSLAFEATVQVRNKLVEAYKDIMNMPV